MSPAEPCIRWGRDRSLSKPSSNPTPRFVSTITGVPRELHLQQGLRVIKEKARVGKGETACVRWIWIGTSTIPTRWWPRPTLWSSDSIWRKREASEFTARDHHSVQIVVAIDGAGVLHAPDCDPVHFAKGDAVVVPAAIPQFRIQAQPQMHFLKSFVPGVPLPEPEIISD